MGPSRRLVPVVLALIATMAVAGGRAAGQVSVQIGPPLAQPVSTAEGCEASILPQIRGLVPVPPSCTIFSINLGGDWSSQVPRGNWVVTRASVRAGPRVGPMRITILRALRSQLTTQGVVCCAAPVQSQVFTPRPNAITTIATNLPVVNTVQNIGGEPVEIVDYLGVSLLDLSSSLPIAAGGSTTLTAFIPALPPGAEQSLPGPSFTGVFPLVAASICPAAGSALTDRRPVSHQVPCAALPGAGPAPGASGGSGGVARVRAGVRRLAVGGGRRTVRVPLACPAGSGRCAGTLAAITVRRLPPGARTARRVALPARHFALAAGAARRVALGVPPAVRRELARGRTVAVVITVRQPGGGAQAHRVTLFSPGA